MEQTLDDNDDYQSQKRLAVFLHTVSLRFFKKIILDFFCNSASHHCIIYWEINSLKFQSFRFQISSACYKPSPSGSSAVCIARTCTVYYSQQATQVHHRQSVFFASICRSDYWCPIASIYFIYLLLPCVRNSRRLCSAVRTRKYGNRSFSAALKAVAAEFCAASQENASRQREVKLGWMLLGDHGRMR